MYTFKRVKKVGLLNYYVNPEQRFMSNKNSSTFSKAMTVDCRVFYSF